MTCRLCRSLCLILMIVVAGCGPVMREVQFTNPRTGLFPMRMDLGIGNEKVDARKLMEAQGYAGVIERETVTVHYPTAMQGTAEQVADAFESARAEIAARTGITWAFKPILYIVPVNELSGGFRLHIRIRKSRDWKLPILVCPSRKPIILSEWSGGIAHELTEASMLASLARREMLLGDYCVLGGGLVNETRWFRDGVSDYAGDILNHKIFGERYQPPPEIHSELARVGELVLSWGNCGEDGVDDIAYYSASRGLVWELVTRHGDDVIARITKAASEDRYINGGTLHRAVKKATGVSLRDFLRDYRTTWLGMSYADTAPSDDPLVVGDGNRVRITAVYRGWPGEKWKVRSGDVIVSVDGRPLISGAWFEHYLATKRPRDRIQVEVERAGERRVHRMMVVARPVGG